MAKKEEKDLQASINQVIQAFIRPTIKTDYKKIFDAVEKRLAKDTEGDKEKQ